MEYSSYLKGYLIVASLGIVGTFTPGPAQNLLMRNSLIYSKKIAVFNLIGVMTASAIIIFLNAFGLGYFIKNNELLFNLTKLLGGSYIFYLGIKSIYAGYKSKSKYKLKARSPKSDKLIDETPLTAFKTGFFLNIFNPKAILFFLGVFSSVIDPNIPKEIIFSYACEFVIVDSCSFYTIIFLFSLDTIRVFFTDKTFYIQFISGVLFIIFSLRLLYSLRDLFL